MFERFSEPARRVLFFARYEVGEDGGAAIESEHLLIGLLREPETLAGRLIRSRDLSIEVVRDETASTVDRPRRDDAAVHLPFSDELQGALRLAAAEADLLAHPDVRTVHLLLGLLRQEACIAALILTRAGVRLDAVRTAAADDLVGESAPPFADPPDDPPAADGESTLPDD